MTTKFVTARGRDGYEELQESLRVAVQKINDESGTVIQMQQSSTYGSKEEHPEVRINITILYTVS